MRMDGPVHILIRTSHRWVYGLLEDETFNGFIFPERSEPIQVSDDVFRGITVPSVPLTIAVENYRETPWFRDSYGYMLMCDHSERYIMTDRDPKTLDLPQRVISGPTDLLRTLYPDG